MSITYTTDLNSPQPGASSHYEDSGSQGSLFATTLTYMPNLEKRKTGEKLDSARVSFTTVVTGEAQLQARDFDSFAPKDKFKRLRGIASSATARAPLIQADVKVADKTLRTFHRFCTNSGVARAAYYTEDGRIVDASESNTSSEDKHAPKVAMMRRVSTDEGKVLAYTGRPETPAKAKEQVTWMFLQELKAGRVGEPDAEGIYPFTYVVNACLSSMTIGYNPKKPTAHQRGIVEMEQQTLKKLSEKPLVIKDPDTDREFRVQCKPIFLQNTINYATEMESALPSWISGLGEQQAATAQGLKDLGLSDREIKRFFSYSPERRVIEIAKLCEAKNLPLVLHCMSSKDRTGIAIALVSAFEQYKKAGFFQEGQEEAMLQDERFKEMFFGHLMIAHNITNYGRGAKGELCGVTLKELYGLEVTHNETLSRLLPKRYVRLSKLSPLKVLTPLMMVVGAIALPIINLIGAIKTRSLRPLRDLPHDFIRLFHLHRLIPLHTINESQRKLTKEHDTFKLTPKMAGFNETINSLTDYEILDLFERFAAQNPTGEGLTEKQKAVVLFLCLHREDLKKILTVSKIRKQFSKKSLHLIEKGLPSIIVNFDTISNADQKRVIHFFSSAGSWKIPFPGHQIDTTLRGYRDDRDDIDVKSLAGQFDVDIPRQTGVWMGDHKISSFQDALDQLEQKRIKGDEAYRILSIAQQAVFFAGYLQLNQLFERQVTLERYGLPEGGIRLGGNFDKTTAMVHQINPSKREVRNAREYLLQEGEPSNPTTRARVVFRTVIDANDDTAWAEFRVGYYPYIHSSRHAAS